MTDFPPIPELSMSDDQLLQKMVLKKKSEGSLVLKEQEKQNREKQGLREFLTVMKKDNKLAPQVLVEEARPPDPVMAASRGPASEGEPTSEIDWIPTSIDALAAMYPLAKAVSDLESVVNGAIQQPHMTFFLTGPHGTKYMIKADESQRLFVAPGNSNPKVFANPGLNPDYDQDSLDDKHAQTAIKPDPVKPTLLQRKTCCHEEDNKVLINKLLASKKITDSVRPVRAPIVETKKVSLDKLNGFLYEVQHNLYSNPSEDLEALADEISSIIAECLVSNKAYVKTEIYEQLIKKQEELLG